MKKYGLFLFLFFFSLHCNAISPWSGIGVVYFNCHYPEMRDTAYELQIYDSCLTQKILTITSSNINLDDNLSLIEFADETFGFCITSIQGNAIKIIISEENEVIQYGWIKKNDNIIGCCLWSDLIPQSKNVFPLNNHNGISEIQFFKSPKGEVLDMSIPIMKELWYDYRNEVIKKYDCDIIPTGKSNNDGWMQVDVSIPHDEGEDVFECHRIRCWIRYIDENGCPLVWFHTRD